MLSSIRHHGARFFPLLLLQNDYSVVKVLITFPLETWGQSSALPSLFQQLYVTWDRSTLSNSCTSPLQIRQTKANLGPKTVWLCQHDTEPDKYILISRSVQQRLMTFWLQSGMHPASWEGALG